MGKFTEGMTRNDRFDNSGAPPCPPPPPAPKPRKSARARPGLSNKDRRILKLEGWTIFREQPIEIRDRYSSVAISFDALHVIANLKRMRQERHAPKKGE